MTRAARLHSQPTLSYIQRNFASLSTLSFVSDLNVKFIVLALLILAGKPNWIASLLLLLIGDWMLQRRFFVLSSKMAATFGSVVVGVAILLLSVGIASVLPPLLVFCGTCLFSVWRVAQQRRQVSAQQ